MEILHEKKNTDRYIENCTQTKIVEISINESQLCCLNILTGKNHKITINPLCNRKYTYFSNKCL